MSIPKFYEMFNPLMEALRNLGGSASNREIVDETAKVLQLTEEEASRPRKNRSMGVFEYRLAWARSYLKDFGAITNSSRGVWVITEAGQKMAELDPTLVKKVARANSKKRKEGQKGRETKDTPRQNSNGKAPEEDQWKVELLDILRKMEPDAFERLSQRLLRESGFTKVEVTGKTGDGGIDGIGKVRLGGLLTFPVVFQCKRYNGKSSIGATTVRDFRGAMVGRADRGLIITTGSFSSAAREEASRDGAPPIDLVDWEILVEKLKDLGLGVKVEMVESIEIDTKYLSAI